MDKQPFSTRRPVTGAAFSCSPSGTGSNLPTPLFNDTLLAADRFIETHLSSGTPMIADMVRRAFMEGAAIGLRYAEGHLRDSHPR